MRTAFAAPAIIALAGAVALGACGGSNATTAATTAPKAATSAAIASPAATHAATPIATPTRASSPVSSPVATPRTTTATATTSAVASPGTTGAKVSGPVDLVTAYNNLVSQNSYEFAAQVQNLPGILSLVPGITPTNTIVVDTSGNDRHVTIANATNATILEMWRVGGTVWAAAAGSAPIQATSSTPVVGQLIPLLDADKLLITDLSGSGATYTVTGTEDVNGTQAQKQTATYQVSPPANPIIPSGTYNVNSQIWVAQSGGYLVQGLLQLGQGAATPAAGSPSVKINVTQIGKPITINKPA